MTKTLCAGDWLYEEPGDEYETEVVPDVFARLEAHHNVRLGPPRRNRDEEKAMMANANLPEGIKCARCYEADVVG